MTCTPVTSIPGLALCGAARKTSLAVAVVLLAASALHAEEPAGPVAAVQVTILSSQVVDYLGEDNDGLGEWGFAALVEADGRKLLFDTGAHPETVLHNARALGLDLSEVEEVVLSHFHDDHTSGLTTLRRELRKKNKRALSVAHVGHGFSWLRRGRGEPYDLHLKMKKAYEALGGRVVEHEAAAQVLPGVWVTGAVPRTTDERNFPPGLEVRLPSGEWVADDVPDDLSLVVDTQRGLVVVSGCGHAGIINTVQVAQARVRPGPVDAVIGGLHLFNAPDERVDWTGRELKRLGVRHLLGAHCTGIEALTRLRAGAGLDRATALQAAVASRYTLEKGIDAGPMGLTK